MAAVTVSKVVVVSPPGETHIKRGRAAAQLTAGNGVLIDGAAAADARFDTTYKLAAAEPLLHGIVVPGRHGQITKANQLVEVMTLGELDGFAGLTPGAELSIQAGVVDTAARPAGAQYRIYAINATRIAVNFF